MIVYCVYTDYVVCEVMINFGFHARFVSSISQLFFGNDMSISINGYYTQAVCQERGIMQGKPLSPFLLSIIQVSQRRGFQIKGALAPPPARSTIENSPVKCLA